MEHTQNMTAVPQDTDVQPYLGRGANGGLPFCPADSSFTFDNSYNLNSLQQVPTWGKISR